MILLSSVLNPRSKEPVSVPCSQMSKPMQMKTSTTVMILCRAVRYVCHPGLCFRGMLSEKINGSASKPSRSMPLLGEAMVSLYELGISLFNILKINKLGWRSVVTTDVWTFFGARSNGRVLGK